MKAVSKMILGAAVMALELASLTGCIVREVVEEIEETTQEKYISKSGNSQSGTLCIQIINNAEGTVLMTDSIEVCNIWIRNSVTGVLQKGSATINLNSQAQTTSATIQLPPQTLTPWSPTTAPAPLCRRM